VSTTSVPEGLRRAVRPEYLKLYVLFSIGAWLLFEDGQAVLGPLLWLGDGPIVRAVFLFLSTVVTLLSLVLVVVSVVAIAVQVTEV
jgi:hypothetical protein